jgi:hypothetical protein
MNYIKYLRELAKSDEFQNLYILSRDLKNIKFFDNDNDFTYVQLLFLRYLNFYYILNNDIAMGDVDEIVLNNSIYEDSYMIYKNKKDKEMFKNNTKTKNKEEINNLNTTKWLFKDSKK